MDIVWHRVGDVEYGIQIDSEGVREGDQWSTPLVGVYRRANGEQERIGEYIRKYPGAVSSTFFPFNFDDREYALYSADYTKTQLMSLPDCGLVTETDGGTFGFCPVEFVVPRMRLPDDTDVGHGPFFPFGLVQGTVWADDWAWKLQFIDLTRIVEGIMVQDDRFGYLPLYKCDLQEEFQSVEGETDPPHPQVIQAWRDSDVNEAAGRFAHPPNYPEDSREYRNAVKVRQKIAQQHIDDIDRGKYWFAEPIQFSIPVNSSIRLRPDLSVDGLYDGWKKPEELDVQRV